jgi:hypothetical protein
VIECPICGTSSANAGDFQGLTQVECRRCGSWLLRGVSPQVAFRMLEGKLGNWDQRSIHLRSRLSHLVRRQQPNNGSMVLVSLDDIETWRLEDPLPSPSEQLDELVLLTGDYQPSPAEPAKFTPERVSAWIGNTITRNLADAGLGWLLIQLAARTLIEHRTVIPGEMPLQLTMAGWDRYQSLKRAMTVSRVAFMAMQFGDVELNRVVDDCFKPAVNRAWFDLRVLTDRQGAGSIDDQLRVALRTSRFVLTDLSHGNNGAYWEAGFAEGLGRPVIYTCKKLVWDDPMTKPHFDTNHLVTIIWEPERLEDAANRLTATIRATLPDEATINEL